MLHVVNILICFTMTRLGRGCLGDGLGREVSVDHYPVCQPRLKNKERIFANSSYSDYGYGDK